ncbi:MULTISPECIES: hypothetical protein [Terrabacteria group]|uniref:hypothetical protein n=1 Tax=Bacillati TaxID=1783272 RepID=UPI001C6EB343|nr:MULTISPECIES: hypothetical protein [Terrabacteria group]MBW9211979.1 hypothetical protein [Trueperella sp. zg.1013]
MVLEIIKNELKRSFKYKEKIILNYFFIIIIVYAEFSVYTGLLKNEESNLMSYLVIANVLNNCLLTNRLPNFIHLLKKGEISKYYTFPKEIWEIIVLEDIATCIAGFAENILFLILLMIFLQISFLRCAFFLVSIFLSLLLSVFVGECFYSLSLPLNNHSASKALLNGVSGILSGGIIPLKYLPQQFIKICYFTPFAFLVDGPVQVLLYEKKEIIIFQLIWCSVLALISYYLFRILSNKTEIYGG